MKVFQGLVVFLLCFCLSRTGIAQIENVAVFGTMSSHVADNFQKAAFQLGTILGKEKKTLIYNVTTSGLSASVFQGAIKENARIVGVTTSDSLDKNCPQNHVCRQNELVITATQTEQRLKMYETADVIVIMPGGWETLAAFSDFVSLVEQEEQSKKPVVFLNLNHYWDDFQYQTDEMKRQHILTDKQLDYIAFVEKSRDVLSTAMKINKKINQKKTR